MSKKTAKLRIYQREGRPSKLYPWLIDRICDLAAQGVPIKAICRHVGIAKPTLYRWVKVGDFDLSHGDGSSLYAQFSEAFERARSTRQTSRRLRVTRVNRDCAVGADAKAEQQALTVETLLRGDPELLELFRKLVRRSAAVMSAEAAQPD